MYHKIFFFVILICMGKAIAQPIEQNYSFNPPPAQDPTYFNDIKPENVLVVYKRPTGTLDTLGNVSELIMNYYVNKRGIPAINIVKGTDGYPGLLIPDTVIYNGESVVLSQDREIIKRNHPCAVDGNNGICDTLAFYYYYEKIALPITNYLNNTIDPNTGNYLKDQIHYIVLCKGIPLKIKSADYGWVKFWKSYHIAIDGLLCLLKTNNNNNPSIMKLYPPTTNIYYGCMVENPYNGIDLDFNFNNRFKANHYFVNKILNDNTSVQFKITCLVSRLDGRNQQEVIDLIDKSYTPDKSGEGTWILDGHYFYSWETEYYQYYNSYNQSTIVPTANKLSQYGFNVYCDGTSRSPIYSYSSPVAGYLSWGRHAGYPIGFVVDNLSFALRPGSVYNTIESYNGASMQSVYRVNEQSLLSEFIQNEGTSGVGHTYEPYLGPNNNPFNFFPSYAMGYNIVEAAYQGIQYLAWQNIVIGDPLTTIAWGKQTLTENKTLSGTNLVTGEVTIPTGKTMTIQNNSIINFRNSGFITGSGVLNIGSNVTINTNSWSRSVLLCNSANNPRLVWAVHPAFSTTNYKVYRAASTTPVSDPSTLTYQLIYTSPNATTYGFTDGDIMLGSGDYIYYCVTAYQNRYPQPSFESSRSNFVTAHGGFYKKGGTEEDQIGQNFSFSLNQNYPNPFNPVTIINYQLPKNGNVTLRIFDILGNEVKTLVNEFKEKGEYTVHLDASLLPSGMYVYQLRVNDYTSTKKMILLK